MGLQGRAYAGRVAFYILPAAAFCVRCPRVRPVRHSASPPTTLFPGGSAPCLHATLGEKSALSEDSRTVRARRALASLPHTFLPPFFYLSRPSLLRAS